MRIADVGANGYFSNILVGFPDLFFDGKP